MKLLKIKNLSKSVEGVKIINNIQMNFEPGKITAIVGPNGAGKTTIFNLVNGFILPDKGSIYYGEQNLASKKVWQITNSGIGRLFQDVRVFAQMTAIDNVMMAFPKQIGENFWNPIIALFKVKKQERELEKKSRQILYQLGIGNKAGELAENLSYGQQKLVAFARLMALSPDVYLLDEPTSGIGVNIREILLDVVKRLAESGKTVIIIEHNLDIVKEIADFVYLINGGKMAAFGNAQEIFKDSDLQKFYL